MARAPRRTQARPRFRCVRRRTVAVGRALVERIEADGDYVRLHVGQRVRLLRASLGDLAERLDPRHFVRIHRSEIVRHDLVSAVRRESSGRAFAVMPGGREVPISKRYLSAIVRTLRLHGRSRDPDPVRGGG